MLEKISNTQQQLSNNYEEAPRKKQSDILEGISDAALNVAGVFIDGGATAISATGNVIFSCAEGAGDLVVGLASCAGDIVGGILGGLGDL